MLASSFLRCLKELQDYLAPRSCAICRQTLISPESILCSHCATQLFHSRPADDRDSLTARLFWGSGPIVRGGVLLTYRGESPASQLLVNVKYRHKAQTCQLLGRALAGFFQPRRFFEGVDLILPVPLSDERLRQRGYNQSGEMARGMARATGIAVEEKAVLRVRDNRSQTRLSSSERHRNMEGAFRVVHPERLDGRHLLILDDVITTGATVSELIRTIHACAPRCTFSILALARGGHQGVS